VSSDDDVTSAILRSPLGAALASLTRSYQQLLDATLALNAAGIPYAICGGFAVAAWCLYGESQLLEHEHSHRRGSGGHTLANLVPPHPITLVNTRDVDMVVRRQDFESRVVPVMGRAGFAHVRVPRVEAGMFLRASRLQAGRRQSLQHLAEEGIHLLFAGEVGTGAFFENPDPEGATQFAEAFREGDYTFKVMDLVPLLQMKLNYLSEDRLKDLIHLVELWESGAITDDILRQVAFDQRWLVGDRIHQFHERFRHVVERSSQSGLRRYAMRGEEIAHHFYALLARVTEPPAGGKLVSNRD
jgi:hypothetical protein